MAPPGGADTSRSSKPQELFTLYSTMDREAGIAQVVEQLICNHQAPCSNHGAGTINGGVAQLGEQLPCTHQVAGSTPVTSTIYLGVGQSDSPSALGAGSRRFESYHRDHYGA